jgi:hypothetical protein
MQKSLIAMVLRKDALSTAAAREWVAIERLKREMRGVPPMKPTSPTEMLAIKAALRKKLNSATESIVDTELEAKESLSPAPVPTPPTTEPQVGGGDLDNKSPHHPQ